MFVVQVPTDTPADFLLNGTLKELSPAMLEKFHWCLTKGHWDFSPISKRKLRKASSQATVEKMLDRYGPENAVKITVKILVGMDLKDLACKLESNYRGGNELARYFECDGSHGVQYVLTITQGKWKPCGFFMCGLSLHFTHYKST